MFANTRRALRWALRKCKRKLGGVQLPNQDWLEKASQYAPYTYDVPELERKSKVLLFVYDNLKRGHDDHSVIADEAEYRGNCFTRGSYHMFKCKEAQNSLALKEQDRPQFGRLREPLLSSQPSSIQGELFLAEPGLLYTLDNIRENGYIYRRERVKLILPYDIEHGSYRTSERQYEYLWAWWYVGDDGWYKAIDADPENFSMVGKYDPKDPVLKPYYSFTMLEYDD